MSEDWPGQPIEANEWPGQPAPRAIPYPDLPISGTSGPIAAPAPAAAQPAAQSWGAAALQVIKPAVEPVVRAFFQGAQEGFGDAPAGMSDKTFGWFMQHGIFRKDDKLDGPLSVMQSAAESLIYPAAAMLDAAMRAPGAIYRGLQAAGVEAGLPRDVVSIPDAFMGTPHPTGIPRGVPAVADGAPREAAAVAAEQGRPGAPSAPDLSQARELGVIGPPRPPIDQGTPAEAAQNAVPPPRAAAVRADDPANVIRSPVVVNPTIDKAGNIRLDMIGLNGDAKTIMQEAAKENDDFSAARAGNVPLAQVESLSQASGVPAATLLDNADGLGRLMKNDAVVRTWLQGFIQASDEMGAQMRKAALTKDPEDLQALAEMRMRFAHMQEQVSGLTAEAGRTLRVFRDFYQARGAAEEIADIVQKHTGDSLEDLQNLANAGAELDRTQIPGFMRDSLKPGWRDYLWQYWVNNLISGWRTHLKYVEANAAFSGIEHLVTTPVAGAIGKVRSLVGDADAERVYSGEAMAALWGAVRGFPDSLRAAWKAASTGMQTELPYEIANNIAPGINNPVTQNRPIKGPLGLAIDIPSRSAAAIHSFFNFMNDRVSIEKQAYRQAADEGLSPLQGDAFWRRQNDIATNPTNDMMKASRDEAYRLSFISELGPKAKAVQTMQKVPILHAIVPFLHIPVNIFKRGYEYTPGAVFDSDMRADLFGKNGTRAQDMAIARVAVGSAFMAWIGNKYLNDEATGDGPRDPSERAQWLLTHQPNSIRVGDHWVSFERFGPAGDIAALGANTAEVLSILKSDDDDRVNQAAGAAVHAASRLVEDDVGMQGLAELLEATSDPQRNGARYVGNTLSTLIPYSSGLRQTAAFMDPYARDAKSVIDGIKMTLTGERETINPKRSWLGDPIPNSAYHTILNSRTAIADPLDLELQRLQIKPTLPENRIGGVKLSPDLFDEYVRTSGPLIRTALEPMVKSPQWSSLPDYVRETAIRSTIDNMRKTGAAVMQMKHPDLIMQGIRQQVDHITGVTHTSRPKEAPAIQ